MSVEAVARQFRHAPAQWRRLGPQLLVGRSDGRWALAVATALADATVTVYARTAKAALKSR